MAYLITCAGSKVNPTINNPSTLQNLSHEDLYANRILMLQLSGIQLDWKKTLPAWQLYSGRHSRLYPHVSGNNWIKPCVKIKILSALFGWINHTDLIPYYDLQMTDRIGPNNFYVWKIWYNLNSLPQFVNLADIDLLSGNYRKAIHGNVNPVAILPPNVIFSGHGDQQGKWLNNQLNMINC